ncbi:MAG: hypothetical protein Q4G33_05450 [bacterium]|nr:hypothetical protein [bacterium]
MKIRQTAAALAFAAALSAPVFAAAQGTFLCMRDGETIAISNDEYDYLKYIELRDSKGALVAPQISSDGNTYLPFRYICDITGIADAGSVAGELPDNSYRFINGDPANHWDKGAIEIKYNGAYYYHKVGETFEYPAADGSMRTVAIYNIRGTLYAPMGYLAALTGSYAAWNEEYSQIMFVSGTDYSIFLDEYNSIRRYKQMHLGYEIFGNNLTDSPLYLKSDGVTIANLSDELPGNPEVRSLSRSGPYIYYIDSDDRLNAAVENTGVAYFITFIDEYGTKLDIRCATAFVLKNKIYGIKTDTAGEKNGRLFSCNLDGTGFKYLTDNNVYNLIMKNNMLDYYLFYCDSDTRSTIHMIPLKTMDNYEVQITNFAHENMLSEIKQFAVGNNNVYYLDTYGSMHVVDLEFPLEEIPITRLKFGNTIYSSDSDGNPLNNITSMNYDYTNDVLYVMQTDEYGKIYCMTPQSGEFRWIGTAMNTAGGLALFRNTSYFNYIAADLPEGMYNAVTEYNDGFVTANE